MTDAPAHLKRAEQALSRLRHAEIETLLDLLDDTQFWIKDADGRYLHVNRAFQLNYSLASADDAVGRTDFDLSPPWLADAFREDDERVLRGERIIHRIELVGGHEGVARWYRTSKIPVHDTRGRVAATAGITQPRPDVETPRFPVPELAPALSAMQRDAAAAWTNTALAELAGLSVSAFERSFRRHLHTTPMRFLKRMRLARAAAALNQTRRAVSEIAMACGFSDQAHLAREFKRMFRDTPTAWRARHLDAE